jgi:Kef-type K+ transport system membrane component KefB
VELLAKGGGGLGKALGMTLGKAVVSVSAMSYVGKKILDPIFYKVAKSGSREAFLSIILSTLFAMSFITKGIGLSDTLGAFLAGILLSETKFHYQIEEDIAPFRGLLLGVFFMTVGFSINVRLLVSQAPTILAMLLAVLTTKTAIIAILGKIFGISSGTAIRTGITHSLTYLLTHLLTYSLTN